jgi:hypothetical protein
LSNYLEVLCCDVIHVSFHSFGGKLLFHRAHFPLLYVEVCTVFWWGSLRERDEWGDPDVDERIILRGIFRKWEGLWGLDGAGSG